jgi:AcrR family transcriptional regulator
METEVQPITEPTDTPALHADARKLFKYSAYLHVGEGALECEHALDGECDDETHFHGWCRLPNAIQQDDIRKKALAAKARVIRSFRDKDADATVVLDNEMAQISDPIFIDMLADEMIAHDFADDYLEAQRDVIEVADSPFEHIAQDRERYTELGGVNVALEDMTDEHRQLNQHINDYIRAVQDRLREIQQPKTDELKARGVEALVKLVRAKRVEQDGDREFLDTYNRWMWFVGTYTTELHPKLKRPHVGMWTEIGTPDRPTPGSMYAAAPEVLDALRETFNDLQLAFSRGSSGN